MMHFAANSSVSLFSGLVLTLILTAKLLDMRRNGYIKMTVCFCAMISAAAATDITYGIFNGTEHYIAYGIAITSGIALIMLFYIQYVSLLVEYRRQASSNLMRMMSYFAAVMACLWLMTCIWALISGKAERWIEVTIVVIPAAISCISLAQIVSSVELIGLGSGINFTIITFASLASGIVQLMTGNTTVMICTVTMSLILIYIMIQSSQEKAMVEGFAAREMDRLQIVTSRMQPHFLYNSLSAIYMLCEENTQVAQSAIEAFSSYLRNTMDALSTRDLVPLKWELEQIDNYLFLENIRFGNSIKVTFDVEDDDFMIPPLCVQSLVDNAVKYGRDGEHIVLNVIVSAKCVEGGYTIKVSDDGKGFGAEETQDDGREHLGIPTTAERIRLLCGGSMTVKSSPGIGTDVSIFIPKGDPAVRRIKV